MGMAFSVTYPVPRSRVQLEERMVILGSERGSSCLGLRITYFPPWDPRLMKNTETPILHESSEHTVAPHLQKSLLLPLIFVFPSRDHPDPLTRNVCVYITDCLNMP